MKVMYLTQWFDPEPGIVKGTKFAKAIEAAGHEVTVVTGLPNYPAGKLYPGYRLRLFQRECIGGVRAIRLPLYPSHSASAVGRSLNFLSFFVSAVVYCLFGRSRYDLAYVYHPPITVGLAAALAGLVRRMPFVLDVQDLWPDSVSTTRLRGTAILVRPLRMLCAFVYSRASAIIVQSDGMRRALIERGVPAAKLTTIRNWSTSEGAREHEPPSGERFRLVYGGNLGPAQALETLIDAATILQDKGSAIDIDFYGEGVEAQSLRRRAAQANLRNVEFRGRVSQAQIQRAFAGADGLLLHLGATRLFEITIPSKTQAYLAAGRPIVAGIAGETAELLEESGAAIVVAPGNAAALANAMSRLAGMPEAEREAMAVSGQCFYRKMFAFDLGIDRTLAVIEGACRRKAPSAMMATA